MNNGHIYSTILSKRQITCAKRIAGERNMETVSAMLTIECFHELVLIQIDAIAGRKIITRGMRSAARFIISKYRDLGAEFFELHKNSTRMNTIKYDERTIRHIEQFFVF
jgi:hypothetical protein